VTEPNWYDTFTRSIKHKTFFPYLDNGRTWLGRLTPKNTVLLETLTAHPVSLRYISLDATYAEQLFHTLLGFLCNSSSAVTCNLNQRVILFTICSHTSQNFTRVCTLLFPLVICQLLYKYTMNRWILMKCDTLVLPNTLKQTKFGLNSLPSAVAIAYSKA
jgi:hypothetical protein